MSVSVWFQRLSSLQSVYEAHLVMSMVAAARSDDGSDDAGEEPFRSSESSDSSHSSQWSSGAEASDSDEAVQAFAEGRFTGDQPCKPQHVAAPGRGSSWRDPGHHSREIKGSLE